MENDEKVPFSWEISKISYEIERLINLSMLFSIPMTLFAITYLKRKLEVNNEKC